MKCTADISDFLQPLRDKPYQTLSEENELYNNKKARNFFGKPQKKRRGISLVNRRNPAPKLEA